MFVFTTYFWNVQLLGCAGSEQAELPADSATCFKHSIVIFWVFQVGWGAELEQTEGRLQYICVAWFFQGWSGVHWSAAGVEGKRSDNCGIKIWSNVLIWVVNKCKKRLKVDSTSGAVKWTVTLNRTKTCTASIRFILELHGTRLGTSWLLFKQRKNHNRESFFLFFCAHFVTGGLPVDGLTAMVVKECCLLSIALSCLWSLSYL